MKPAEFIDEFVHTAEEKWIPPNGASVVAKAWTDPAFKVRLLANGRDAVAKLGLPLSIDIRVWDTQATPATWCCRCCRGTDGWFEEKLASLVTETP